MAGDRIMPAGDDNHTDFQPDSAAHAAAMAGSDAEKKNRKGLGKAAPKGGIIGTAAKVYGAVATGGASTAFNG